MFHIDKRGDGRVLEGDPAAPFTLSGIAVGNTIANRRANGEGFTILVKEDKYIRIKKRSILYEFICCNAECPLEMLHASLTF